MPDDSMIGIEDLYSGIDFNRHSGGIESAWAFLLSRAVALQAGSPMSPIGMRMIPSRSSTASLVADLRVMDTQGM